MSWAGAFLVAILITGLVMLWAIIGLLILLGSLLNDLAR